MLEKVLAKVGAPYKAVPEPVGASADELSVVMPAMASSHSLLTCGRLRFSPEEPAAFEPKVDRISRLLERMRDIHAAGVAHLNLRPECFFPYPAGLRTEVMVGNFTFLQMNQ